MPGGGWHRVFGVVGVCVPTAALAGCAGPGGDEHADPEPPDRLDVTRDDGRGTTFRIELDCDRGDRDRCARIAGQLSALRPDPDEVCAEVFVGPESIAVSGRLGGEPVLFALDRSDSCADARYRVLDALLRPSAD